MDIQRRKFQKTFRSITNKKKIHEAVLLVENSAGDVSCRFGYGGKDVDTPFLIASITKLFTTTCIFILEERGKLSLDDKITKYLSKHTVKNLHIYKDLDYTNKLTISSLLCHTSGLRDAIEEGSNASKKRGFIEDRSISFDEAITKTKETKPVFAPDARKKAHYANINFDILGKIIETVTNMPLEEVYQQFICNPLGLKSTYLPVDEDDFIPQIYYNDTPLYRPKLIKSIRASGGCISTASEIMIFIKAFIKGKLFDYKLLLEQKIQNRLQAPMFPIHYGAGYMKIALNGLPTLFMGKGELIGHSGSTGSFAFYHPEKDMFFVGDVNQMKNPATPVRLVMRLAMSMK